MPLADLINTFIAIIMRYHKLYSRWLITCLLLLPAVSYSDTSSDEVGSESFKPSFNKPRSDLHINGFLTVGVNHADPEVTSTNESYRSDLSFDTKAILGLQATYQLTSKFNVTGQIVSKADKDWGLDTDLDWAFFRYHLTDDLTFRAGRLRLPLYFFSESAEVGFSYPWVTPPSEVYVVPLFDYEGADFLYSMSTGDWIHQLQVFGGSVDTEILKASTTYGINLTSSSGPWTYRASFLEINDAELNYPTFPQLESSFEIGDAIDYYAAAAIYDDGDWLLISELSVLDTGSSTVLFGKNSGYITIGKYIDHWLPYFSYGKSYTTNEAPSQVLFELPVEFPPFSIPVYSDILEFTTTSYSLGLRYNLNANTSVKFQWSHFTDFDGTGGRFFNLRFSNSTTDVDSVDTFALVIDMVF